eukprot:gene20380-biopygen11594
MRGGGHKLGAQSRDPGLESDPRGNSISPCHVRTHAQPQATSGLQPAPRPPPVCHKGWYGTFLYSGGSPRTNKGRGLLCRWPKPPRLVAAPKWPFLERSDSQIPLGIPGETAADADRTRAARQNSKKRAQRTGIQRAAQLFHSPADVRGLEVLVAAAWFEWRKGVGMQIRVLHPPRASGWGPKGWVRGDLVVDGEFWVRSRLKTSL